MKEFLQEKVLTKDYSFSSYADQPLFEFAKDLTLEQFLNTCPRGDWILELFVKTNPDSLRELFLAKGHCANTVRHLMIIDNATKSRARQAVDVTIAFGKGKATVKELNSACDNAAEERDAQVSSWSCPSFTDALEAAISASHYQNYPTWFADSTAAEAASAAGRYAGSIARKAAWDVYHLEPKDKRLDNNVFCDFAKKIEDAARYKAIEENQQQTADICRRYLPLKIWNQNLI